MKYIILSIVLLNFLSCNVLKTITEGETNLSEDFFGGNNDDHSDNQDNNSDNQDNNVQSCPSGYVLVENNSTIVLDDFCVMEYEARNDGSGNPISDPNSAPWVSISAVDAASECESIGSNYHLISNSEWIVIARNIENEGVNWSGGAVESGCLFQGNTGLNSSCSYNNSSTVDFGLARDTKASLALNNGNIIWDLSGNVAEWTDWDKDTPGFQTGPTTCATSQTELSSVSCGGLTTDDYDSSISTLSSAEGSGTIFGGTGGAATRGGIFSNGNAAGIFNLQLNQTTSFTGAAWGFRCVYRFN